MMRHRQQPVRGWLRASSLASLLGALGSCGHTSTSDAPVGSASLAGASGVGGAGAAGATTSVAGVSGAGVSSAGAAPNAAGTAGTDTGGDGGASVAAGGGVQGGAAGDSAAIGGAGGADDCVDVCSLYGQACCATPAACVTTDASCVIEVFDYHTTSVKNEYPALEQLVATLAPTFRASVSTADVVSSLADPFPASRIELHLSAQASATYGAALEGALMDPFRVSCGGQTLFFGQVYMLEGAQAIETPVLHVSRDASDAIVLRIGARQGAWGLSFPVDDIAARERIDRPELRSTLCLDGALGRL